jgi:hypothetical protein
MGNTVQFVPQPHDRARKPDSYDERERLAPLTVISQSRDR